MCNKNIYLIKINCKKINVIFFELYNSFNNNIIHFIIIIYLFFVYLQKIFQIAKIVYIQQTSLLPHHLLFIIQLYGLYS